MKKLFLRFIIICSAPLGMVACNNNGSGSGTGPDSANTKMADTAMTADTSTMKSMPSNTGGTTGSSNDFVDKAASGGMMEVELGKYAQQNGASQDVKDYGKMLETDHSKANAELKSIAAAENINIPSEMSEMHAMHVKDLESKKGADFDKAYIDMMIDDHAKDIDAFKTASASNSNEKVKAFAGKTLPVLQMHSDKAKSLKSKMK